MPSLPLQDRNCSPRNRIGPGLRSRRRDYSARYPYTSSSRELSTGDYLSRRVLVAVVLASSQLKIEYWLKKNLLARAF